MNTTVPNINGLDRQCSSGRRAGAPRSAGPVLRLPRVVHVLRELAPGGIEYWLLDLAQAGGVAGFQLEILVERAGGALEGAFREAGVALGVWSRSRPAQLVRALRGAAIVHSHVHAASGWILTLAALAGAPVRLAHSHCCEDPAAQGYGRRLYAGLMRSLLAIFATEQLAVSAQAGEALFGSRAPVRILPPARNLRQLPLRARRCRAGSCSVGFIGRLVSDKNPGVLLGLLGAFPDLRLILAGDGPWRGALAAAGEGRIEFVTRETVLAQADCLVLPSFREGLGLAAIEAQAAGLPAVLSTGVAAEAVIRPDLVWRVDPHAPLCAWRQAIDEAAARARGGGSEDVRWPAAWDPDGSLYHIEPNRRLLAALYREALNRRRRAGPPAGCWGNRGSGEDLRRTGRRAA